MLKTYSRLIWWMLLTTTILTVLFSEKTGWIHFVNCFLLALPWWVDTYFEKELSVLRQRLHRLQSKDPNLVLYFTDSQSYKISANREETV